MPSLLCLSWCMNRIHVYRMKFNLPCFNALALLVMFGHGAQHVHGVYEGNQLMMMLLKMDFLSLLNPSLLELLSHYLDLILYFSLSYNKRLNRHLVGERSTSRHQLQAKEGWLLPKMLVLLAFWFVFWDYTMHIHQQLNKMHQSLENCLLVEAPLALWPWGTPSLPLSSTN